tara:strand:+ start:14 stop:6085 length:6072 start_codon:yes stop_codon:yes gene_type:complete
MQGKMNKDLDERLIRNGEYRDALNIEVTTSEGSDVGSVENIIGNSSLNPVQYKEPYYDGNRQAFDRDGFPLGYNFSPRTSDPYITSYSSTAEVVGSVADEKNQLVYSFIANALDFEDTPNISGSGTYKGGVKTDVIVEVDPVNGFNNFVFVDCWQVQRQWGKFVGGTSSFQQDIDGGYPGAHTPADPADDPVATADGTTVIKLKEQAYWNYLNGLVRGMKVELINTSGQNVWEPFGEVTLLDFGAFYNEATPADSYVYIKLSKGSAATTSNDNFDNYLRFTKTERLLNFNSGESLSYTEEYLNGSGQVASQTVSSNTSISNKIASVDTFDGLLYWTDGVSEPKKINIERSKLGTFNQNLYNTTEFVYIDHTEEYKRDSIKLTDITVIKQAPFNAPDMDLSLTTRSGNTHKIGIAAINLYNETIDGAEVTLTIQANQNGQSLAPSGWKINLNNSGAYTSGDIILLQSVRESGSDTLVDGYEVEVELTEHAGNFNTTTGYITSAVGGTVKGIIRSKNAAFTEFGDGLSLQWEAMLIEPGDAMYKEKFVRFASRWRYIDGEVSALSPFTQPAFIPQKSYSYSSEESFNESMVNGLRKLTIHRFIPTNIPKEVEEVDILYKEDGNNNIYLLKTIKRKDRKQTGTGVYSYPWTEDGPLGADCPDKGSLVLEGSTFGSVIPSNQILRPFDAVPRKAKSQVISASRLMYGNYTENYNMVDAAGKNIDVLFKNWQDNIGIQIRNTNYKNQYSPYGCPSIKSGRSYTVGLVYKDKFGRESSVIIGETSNLDFTYNNNRAIALHASLNHNPPYWAEYFKFFIKENSNEYYNITLHRAFSAGLTADNQTFEAWLAFNSADRNKINEGDYLLPRRNSRNGGPTGFMTEEFKVIDISNEAPEEVTLNDSHEIEDIEGKFFVKVKNNRALTQLVGINNEANWNVWSGNASKKWPISPVFEVKPDPQVDVNVFYEVPKTYPINLSSSNANSLITTGDRVMIYYKQTGGSTQPTAPVGYEDSSDVFYNNLPVSITKVEGPAIQGGLTKITLDTSITLGATTNQSSPGTIHIYDKNGGSLYLNLAWNAASGGNYSGGGATTSIVYVKSYAHNAFGLSFWNCFSFKNGVESNRIRDDFNATTIANGVKVSTTSESYREKQVKTGIIFSGIYNSKNGVNNLNQFISAEGIRKDLNPQFGSIQKLHARDTDITVCCEDKIVKVLCNKEALFNADSSGNITSTKSVLGQTIAYQGDYGIGTNPESFVAEEFRSYFIDASRGAVLRLSRDGLTNIANQGMGDFFGDVLKTTKVAIGAYNRDKGEYDLTLNYDIDGTSKKVKTISYSENVKGWTCFKSYTLENGLSMNNNYYTFKQGQTYLHSDSSVRNNFYGTQYFSSVTPVINDTPGVVKSFTSVNYEGTQARTLSIGDDQDYYNNIARRGWYVDSILTNKQTGRVLEFKEKEGKWFNYIHGDLLNFDNSDYSSANLDTQEISVQGLGFGSSFSGVSAGQETIVVTSDAIANTTITSGSTTVITGSSLNGLSTTFTITPNLCYYFSASDLSFDVSGVAQIANVVLSPSSDNVYSDTPITVTVNFANVNLTSSTTITLTPTLDNPAANACISHQVDVDVDLPAVGYTYTITSADNYNAYLEEETSSLFESEIIGESIVDQSNAVFTATFTADENFFIPDLNSFNPTSTLDNAANWTEVKTPTYDAFGNIAFISYSYSYTGQSTNPSDPFDKYVFPDVTMSVLNEVITPLPPESTGPSETSRVIINSFYWPDAGATTNSQSLASVGLKFLDSGDYLDDDSVLFNTTAGNQASSLNGYTVVIAPTAGNILAPASGWTFNSGGSNIITAVAFSDNADGTVTATFTFDNTVLTNAGVTLNFGIRGTLTQTSQLPYRFILSERVSPGKMTVTAPDADLSATVASGGAIITGVVDTYAVSSSQITIARVEITASGQTIASDSGFSLSDITLPNSSYEYGTYAVFGLTFFDDNSDGNNDRVRFDILWTPPNISDLSSQGNTFDFGNDSARANITIPGNFTIT